MSGLLPLANVLGALLMAFALTYLLPIVTSLGYDDGAVYDFAVAMALDFAVGLVLWGATRHRRAELRPRDGYLLVTVGWLIVAASASLPFMLFLPGMSFTDAFFETMSGLTTTGATVMTGLDSLAPSVNLWRHALNWYGGMGIIVFSLAILPVLGVGGMQLYRAEVPGAVKESKLTPRIADTAKALWTVYFGFTLVAILALRVAGMNWFDAVSHAFSAISLGGFSTRDAGIAYYESQAVETVLIVIMLVGAMNFATHFTAVQRRTLALYPRDPEARSMLVLLGISVLGIALYLTLQGVYPTYGDAVRHAAFNVVSVATTGGFSSVDYARWPVFATFWMLFLACITCSTGSTGSGVKMFRTMMLVQQTRRELARLMHPRLVAPLKFGRQVVPNNIIYAILAFIFVYFVVVVGLTFVLLLSGMELVTAFSAVVGCLNNVGPGLDGVGPAGTYAGLSAFQKWLLMAAMLAGRLELFTVLVLFTPTFWRK